MFPQICLDFFLHLWIHQKLHSMVLLVPLLLFILFVLSLHCGPTKVGSGPSPPSRFTSFWPGVFPSPTHRRLSWFVRRSLTTRLRPSTTCAQTDGPWSLIPVPLVSSLYQQCLAKAQQSSERFRHSPKSTLQSKQGRICGSGWTISQA